MSDADHEYTERDDRVFRFEQQRRAGRTPMPSSFFDVDELTDGGLGFDISCDGEGGYIELPVDAVRDLVNMLQQWLETKGGGRAERMRALLAKARSEGEDR